MKSEIARPRADEAIALNQNTQWTMPLGRARRTYRMEEMSLKQEIEALRQVPMFAELDSAKLKLLAFMSERVAFDPGKLLMQRGDLADAAYLIVAGHAEVIFETPDGAVVVAILGANQIVGEMGILGNAPRTATVRAKDRLIALRISREPFMRMVREFPTVAVSIMRELAQRFDKRNGDCGEH